MLTTRCREFPKARAEVLPARSKPKSEKAVGGSANPLWHRFATRPEAGPSRLGTWARLLFHAPETRPADAAERSAEAAADAAVRDERSSPPATANAIDTGTPPWGNGRRLSHGEREWHEQRIGANIADVRVHEGAVPGRWAKLLGARAFSFGRDVVMGSGEYTPGTDAGHHLLAHELSHVVAARGRTPVLARAALTAADFDALADSVHNAITTPADEELIYVALQKLERNPTAVKSLTDAYKKRHKKSLITDLASRLKGHGLGLAKTLLGAKGGLAVATKPPGNSAEYEAAARAVNAALGAKTVDAEGIYAALLPLDREPGRTMTLKTTYATLFTASLETDLNAKLTGTDLSYALYLLYAPRPATPHSPVSFSAQPGFGTLPTTALPAAAGGTVSAGTQVPWQTAEGKTGTFGFGVGYSGALSADSRWLQFIEREIDYIPKGGGKPVALDKEISTGRGGNKYRLTTVSTSPNWVVDSYDPSNPFFDETHAGTTWRDATSVSIYDAPAALDSHVKELFNGGAPAVTSRAHFDIYLIRDFSAIYHVEIEIIWTFSDPKTRTISRNVKSVGSVSVLPSNLMKALVARYPTYAYIR